MMRWGQTLAVQGRHEEAIGRYRKTLEIESDYPEALVAWAESLIALGQHVAARRKYEEAVSMAPTRSEEHTSELQSLMRSSYAVFCLKTKIIPRECSQRRDIKT